MVFKFGYEITFNNFTICAISWFSQYWQQQGQDIDSEAAGDQFGISVSVNAAGDRVAIGAAGNNEWK